MLKFYGLVLIFLGGQFSWISDGHPYPFYPRVPPLPPPPPPPPPGLRSPSYALVSVLVLSLAVRDLTNCANLAHTGRLELTNLEKGSKPADESRALALPLIHTCQPQGCTPHCFNGAHGIVLQYPSIQP